MIRLVWSQLGIAFSALLPLVNPLGSALVFYGLVGAAPPEVYRRLARRIAINTVLFLLVIELIGAALLSFFGVSLPIVEFAGGLVLAAMGWSLLNQQGADAHQQEKANQAPVAYEELYQKTFYPLTFPVTAGPGCIVIMLTLTAHASTHSLIPNLLAHLGILIAVIVLCLLVYFAYAYAPLITHKISPQTARGVVRVIAFLLLCIGVQIAWKGVSSLLLTLMSQR
ncbi:MAG: MarC family protein [Acidobacteriaceae bacterium]